MKAVGETGSPCFVPAGVGVANEEPTVLATRTAQQGENLTDTDTSWQLALTRCLFKLAIFTVLHLHHLSFIHLRR